MYEIKLEKFQGPLSLLLQLIEQEELDITEVSLGRVADEFLKHLHEVEELNPEEVADFLVVASKLLLIKSRLLLPTLDLGGQEETAELEYQLKLYREYLEASRQLDALWRRRQVSYLRPKPLWLSNFGKFMPPRGFSAAVLEQTLRSLLYRLSPLVRLPEIALQKAVSIQDKIDHLKKLIVQHITVNWQTIVAGAKDKTEIIVSFLALLELVKQRQLKVEQPGLFGDIKISKSHS
ncbi:MAG: segregation/condensation protein A [Candidatus Kerfeldbacteria bacterium]|nr:segregation/condensation protein A [Candidatus Kerfeldbacteria bacterium]